MATLVSNACHTPVAVFDEAEAAIGYVCSWYNISTRFVVLKPIDNTTMFEVKYQKDTLGFIREGICHNPTYIHRS